MYGCNFRCGFCQNWQLSDLGSTAGAEPEEVSAAGLAAAAKDSGARLLVSTYNEPLITAEWAAAVFAEGKKKGLLAAFVSNGYAIRRLNQAYFAFYGAYNAEPGGAPAAGRDPIGPAVQALRERSPSVGDFLRTIAGVRTLDDVMQAGR
jgi:hypothetical protein